MAHPQLLRGAGGRLSSRAGAPNARQSQKPRCASPLFRLSLGPAVSAQLFAWDSAACRIEHAAGNDWGRRAWRTFSFCAALEAASSALPSLACAAACALLACSACAETSHCVSGLNPMPYGAVSERSLLSWAVLQSACIYNSCRETSRKPDF